jgi:threonine dehydrogenase-like Zn-dependent dehydrogenase
MQAALLWKSGKIMVEDRPRPKPRPGWSIIRVMACGICGSDMHVGRGHIELPIKQIGTGFQMLDNKKESHVLR